MAAQENVGVVGDNGIGKSTFLKVVASLIRPSQGEVLFYGRPIKSQVKAYRRQINYTAGAPMGFYPRLTGIENLRFFSAMKGKMISVPHAKDLVRRVSLPADAGDKKYHQFPLGMKQRLGVGSYVFKVGPLALMNILLLSFLFSTVHESTLSVSVLMNQYTYFIPLCALSAAIGTWETELFESLGEMYVLEPHLVLSSRLLQVMVELIVPCGFFLILQAIGGGSWFNMVTLLAMAFVYGASETLPDSARKS